MNRGNLLQLAVERSSVADDKSKLIGSCIGSVLLASERGDYHSSVSLIYPSSLKIGRVTEVGAAFTAANDLMQQEGFQTDEVLGPRSDHSLQRQLVLFWADGKRTYEANGQLGVFNQVSDVSITVLPDGLAIHR